MIPKPLKNHPGDIRWITISTPKGPRDIPVVLWKSPCVGLWNTSAGLVSSEDLRKHK